MYSLHIVINQLTFFALCYKKCHAKSINLFKIFFLTGLRTHAKREDIAGDDAAAPLIHFIKNLFPQRFSFSSLNTCCG